MQRQIEVVIRARRHSQKLLPVKRLHGESAATEQEFRKVSTSTRSRLLMSENRWSGCSTLRE